MALNVVGQALLVHELIDSKKLVKGATVMYSSSEAARGVPSFGFPPPAIETGSKEEFVSALDGSLFVEKIKDTSYEATYGYAKCLGTLWTSAMARKNTDCRFVSVSPGMTFGTNLVNELDWTKRMVFAVATPIVKLFGMGHDTDFGAKRYLDVIYETDTYENGRFYGSVGSKLTGPLGLQDSFFEGLSKEEYQDNAYDAIQTFISK